jgi:signal transduction histidine kinase
VVVDLTHRGRREGILVVGLRRGQRRFSGRESALLDDLARQLAVTIRAVRLSGELEHSRERIVRAREAERLRIRRDLHDGLGPVLAAAGLQADTLRDHLDPDDAAAHALLDRMGVGLRQGVGDIRRTVEGLRPPALDQIGLAAVVAEHAAALDSPRLSVATELDELAPGAVPAAVEVAAYRIAVEALTNGARHSGARRCTVRLARERETLVVEVVDDGRGLATDVHLGVGLTSMRERAEELGGSLLVTAPAAGVDGTLVRAVLPVHGGT